MTEEKNRNHLSYKWLTGILISAVGVFISGWVYMLQANINGIQVEHQTARERLATVENQSANLTESIKELKAGQIRIEEKLDKVLRISNILTR